MTQQPQLYVPSAESLARCTPDALLDAFIDQFNGLAQRCENLDTALKMQEQQTTSYQRLCSNRLSDISKISEICEKQRQQIEQLRQQLEQSQKAAANTDAMANELLALKKQHKDLQAAWNAANPDKLKKQIKRIQTDGANAQATIQQLQQVRTQLTKQRNEARHDTQRAIDKIKQLNHQLEQSAPTGIYHKGDDHLFVWPQLNTMFRDDGTSYPCQALLYMNSHGRGILLSYDPECQDVIISSAPKGGTKAKAATLEFAENWLHQVNVVQGGTISPLDMIKVDHNTEANA